MISTAPNPAEMQRRLGNRGTQAWVAGQGASQPVQAKFTVGKPDDIYEKEADRVAETVMRMPEPATRQGVADVGASRTTVDAPLSPGQVVRALSYYARRAKQYTPDIIMQIQVAVGTTPTGRMTPVDVQAVAKKQQEVNVDAEPKLKIDGMAGPRTLPSVFKFGLSEEESISEYTEKAKEKWDNRGGKREEEIARNIVNELINERFKELGIPPLNVAITEDLGSRGTFRSSTWTMSLGARQFRPKDKFHDLRATTATIYHEARHAEHDFRIAQMLARKGKDAAQINARTGLELSVAERAVTVKDELTPMQALIAEHWFDSLYGGAGIEARRRISEKLRVRFAARERACEIFKRNPTPRNRERLKRAKYAFGQAVDEHDDLPHEFDPERLENKIKQLFGETVRPDDPCRSV